MKFKELKAGNLFRFRNHPAVVCERLFGEKDYYVIETNRTENAEADLEVIFVKNHWSEVGSFEARLWDLQVGQKFVFVEAEKKYKSPAVYEYRGNGWYGSVAGYDGGPWHKTIDENPEVAVR